jgi:hypothetical protein
MASRPKLTHWIPGVSRDGRSCSIPIRIELFCAPWQLSGPIGHLPAAKRVSPPVPLAALAVACQTPQRQLGLLTALSFGFSA